MQRVINVISDIDKALAFEWIFDDFKDKTEIWFVLLNPKDSELEKFLRQRNGNVVRILFRGKKDYLKVFFALIKFYITIKPHIVHTHLRHANILGLSAAWLCRVKKRIYTRHSSTLNIEYFPHAVKWDKLINRLSTDIVAISENVREVLINENVSKEKISLIHHGFPIEMFEKMDMKRVEELRSKYEIKSDDFPIVGMISRYVNWKGHKYAIEAFSKVLEEYPKAKFILANASGYDAEEIKKNLNDNLASDRFVEISFEYNLFALYQLFDVFVHVPINKRIEAFGQTYVEALASGIPSVVTLSGIAPELIEHKKNALVVPYKDANSIYQSISLLLKDDGLRGNIVENGRVNVKEFSLEKYLNKLQFLYEI